MYLKVSLRMGTRGRQIRTSAWAQLIEDLANLGVAPACIVAVGFAGYKMLAVSIDVPSIDISLHADLAGTELRAALGEALGFDPRLLGGRLTVIVEGPYDTCPSEDVISALEDLGYAAEIVRAAAS
jgi:hypothetical protein